MTRIFDAVNGKICRKRRVKKDTEQALIQKKRAKALFFNDQTDKPGSVVCGNLSTLTVAGKLKPSLLYIRRASVKI